MRWIEKFALGIPYLFLKKIPYAWLGVVFLWGWPPVASGIFLTIVLLGLLVIAIQRRAWEAMILNEHHTGPEAPYIDHPHQPPASSIRNLALLILASGLMGWWLNGLFGFHGLQWFFMSTGFMILYRDALLFGSPVTYILTGQGIGIRFIPGHVDYRLFFTYDEIRQAARIQVPKTLPFNWEVITPRRSGLKEGLLLTSNNPGGFSKHIEAVLLLSPSNMGAFVEHLARYLDVCSQ